MKKFKSKKLKLIGIGVVIGLLVIVGVIFSIQIAVNSLISKQGKDNKEYQSINNSYLKSQNVLNLNATQINHNNEYEFNSSQIKLQTFDLNNPKITIDFYLKDENNQEVIHNEIVNTSQSKMFISTWNYNLYQDDIKPLYKTYYFSNTKEIVFKNNQIENIALLTQQLTYIPSIKFSDNEVYYQLDLDTSNLNNFQTINQFLIDHNLNQHQQQTIFSLIPTKLMFLIDKNSNPNLIFKNNSIYHQHLLSQQTKTYTLNSQDILQINPKSQFMYEDNQKSIDFKIVSDLELKDIIDLIRNNKEIVYNGNHNLNKVIEEFVKNINQITSDIKTEINNTDLDAMHLKVENKTIANLKFEEINKSLKITNDNFVKSRKNYNKYFNDPKLYKEYLVNKQQHNGIFYHFKELLKPNQYYDYDNNNFYFHNQNKRGGNPTKDLMKRWLNNYPFTNFNDFLHQHFTSKINSKGGGGDIVNIYWFDIKEYWEYIAPTFANNNEQIMYLLMFLYHIIYNSSFNTIEDQNLRYTPQEINEQIDYILHQIYFLTTNDPNSFIKFVNENNKVFTFNQKNSILYNNDNVIDIKNHTQTDINLYVKYLINQLSPYWISLIIKNPSLSIDTLKNHVLQLIIDTITSKYYHLQSTKKPSQNFDKIQDLKNTLLSSTNIKNSEDIYGFILNTVLNQKYHQYTFKDDVNLLIRQIQNVFIFKESVNKNDKNSIHSVLNQYLKDIKKIKKDFTDQINQKTNLQQLNLKVDNVILDYNKDEKINYIIKNPLKYTPKTTNEFNKLLNYEYEISTKTYEINYDAYINQIDLSSIDTLLKQKEYQYAILYSQNKESVSHLFNLINYRVYHPKYTNEDLGFYQQLYNLVYDYFKNDTKSISGKDVINYLQKYVYQPINNFYLNYPFNELNNPLESSYFNQIDYSFDYNNQLYLDTIFSGIQDYQSKLDPNSLIKTYQQLYQKQDFEFFYLDETQFKYLYNQNTIISNKNVYVNVIETTKDETKYQNNNEINTINFNLHHHDFVAFYDFNPLTKHELYGDFLLKIINSYQPILYENSEIDVKTFNDFDKNTQDMFNQIFLEYTNTKNNLKKIVNDTFNLKIYLRQKLYLNDYASISDDIIENYIYNDNNKAKIVNTNQYINNIYNDYDWEFSNDDFKFINYELINNHINQTNNIKLNKTITNNFNYFNNPNFENEIKNTKGLIISNLTKTNNINNLSHTTRDLYNLEYLGTSGGFSPIYNNLNHNKNNNSSKVKFDFLNYYEVDDVMYNSFGFNKVNSWGFGYVIGQEKYTIFYVLNHNKGAYKDPNHVFVRLNSVHMFDNKNHYLGFNTKNNLTVFDFNNPYSDKSFIDYFKNLNNEEIFKDEYKPIEISAMKLNVNFSFSNDK